MSMNMDEAERQGFLAGIHIGVLSIPDGDRGPLTVPLWYAYEPGGDIVLVTPTESRKGKLLEEGLRVSLVAQDEEMPPKYVSIEGPVVSITPADVDDDVRPMATRYLGDEIGNAYVDMTRAEDPRDELVVRIRPERWFSVDYAKRTG